jgi:hypothetical protein
MLLLKGMIETSEKEKEQWQAINSNSSTII